MTVHLTPSQQELVDELLETSAYPDEAAVMTAALEALKARRQQDQEARAEIREDIEHGYAQTERGELLHGPTVMAELHDRLEQWRAANKAP